MLVTSKACNPTSTRLFSNKTNQPEVTGKTLTEPNDLDQNKIYEKACSLSISFHLTDTRANVFWPWMLHALGGLNLGR
jgi:hypothetical protein